MPFKKNLFKKNKVKSILKKNLKRIFWRLFFIFSFVFLVGAFYVALLNPLGPPVLKILTYSSFAGAYGPGPLLKNEFEKHCSCEVQWFLSEDSTLLSQRFHLLPAIDIVLGWDQITKLSTNPTAWESLFALQKNYSTPQFLKFIDSKPNTQDEFFIPYNWSPIGFLARKSPEKKGKIQVSSLEDLKKFSGRFSIPEPRTSNLGLQFYYWLYEVYKGDFEKIAEYLNQIKDQLYGPVPSWSLAYGFFRKGQTDLGFSYLSSLLYHQKEEPHKKYFFLTFESAHPYQVEFFSISKKSKNKNLAFRFAKLLLSEKGQKIVSDKNYMLPISSAYEFEDMPELLSYHLLDEFMTKRKELLELWETQD